MIEVFVVECRFLKKPIFGANYLACEPVFFASTLKQAEQWMLDQDPGWTERYYYCVYKTLLDSDRDFDMVGYYDLLGQRSTLDRCIEIITKK